MRTESTECGSSSTLNNLAECLGPIPIFSPAMIVLLPLLLTLLLVCCCFFLSLTDILAGAFEAKRNSFSLWH